MESIARIPQERLPSPPTNPSSLLARARLGESGLPRTTGPLLPLTLENKGLELHSQAAGLKVRKKEVDAQLEYSGAQYLQTQHSSPDPA